MRMKTQAYTEDMEMKNILVVEDDELLKPILARVLYSIDDKMSIKWVTNFEEAKKALIHDIYDLVISDVILDGDQSGLELYRHCGAYHPDTLLLIISSLSREMLEELLGAEIDPACYLSKPIAIGRCKQLILALAEQKGKSEERGQRRF
jgi:DNA-binding NtrC family response regulator